MPCLVAKCLKCHFAWTVSPDVWLIIGWTNFRREKWSMKMVAYLYCLTVSLPLSCAMKPSSFDCISSIEMHSPGLVAKNSLLFTFVSYLLFCHRTKHTASTFGRLDLGQLLGDLAIFDKILEVFEWEMTKAVMPSHQFGLVIIGLHVITLLICMGERALGKIIEIVNFVWQNLFKKGTFPPFMIACWMKWKWLRRIDVQLTFDIANFDCFILSNSSLRVWHLVGPLMNYLVCNELIWEISCVIRQLVDFDMKPEMRCIHGLETCLKEAVIDCTSRCS